METTRDDIRECIADRLDGQAEWRDEVAKEHPDDERNVSAAEAMRACAAYVRDLPADDPRLVELDSVSLGMSPFMFRGRIGAIDFEDESRLWGQIGFHDFWSPSDYLDQIVEFYLERTVTTGALIKRVNRRLVKEGRKLLTTRGARMIASVGSHYVIDVNRSFVVDKYVDVEELARQLGVLRPREQVA